MSKPAKRLPFLILTLTLFAGLGVKAQHNYLDSSFNQTGIRTQALTSLATASCTTLDSQNNILVGGSAYLGNWRFAFLRLRPDGSLDTTLNHSGMIVAPSINGGDTAYAIATAPQEKIVIAGFYFDTSVSNDHFAVMRYLPDGSADSSFGKNGVVYDTVIFGRASSVLVQNDGKVIVVGTGAFSKTEVGGFMMLRLLADGRTDTSFGNGGYVRTTSGGTTHAYSALLLPGGKIVIGGSGFSYFKLAQYYSNGRLDSAFGSNGLVEVNIGSDYSYGTALLRRTDGSLILAGSTGEGKRPIATMLCVRQNGRLNDNFGSGGLVLDSINGPIMYVGGIVQLSDGELVLGGTANDSLHSNFAIARFFSNGKPDRNFGTGGICMSQVGESYSYITGMVAQPNNKIIAAGWSWGTVATNEFAVARYQSLTPLKIASSGGASPRIKVFPNPAITTLNILCESSPQQAHEFWIRSIDGKLILSGSFRSTANLELNSLARGTYLLTVRSEGFIESQLFMKD